MRFVHVALASVHHDRRAGLTAGGYQRVVVHRDPDGDRVPVQRRPVRRAQPFDPGGGVAVADLHRGRRYHVQTVGQLQGVAVPVAPEPRARMVAGTPRAVVPGAGVAVVPIRFRALRTERPAIVVLGVPVIGHVVIAHVVEPQRLAVERDRQVPRVRVPRVARQADRRADDLVADHRDVVVVVVQAAHDAAVAEQPDERPAALGDGDLHQHRIPAAVLDGELRTGRLVGDNQFARRTRRTTTRLLRDVPVAYRIVRRARRTSCVRAATAVVRS